MENTLLVIFDDLESPNPTLVSRGLDCLDQLLADICLPSHTQHLESTISSVRHSKSSTVGHKKGYKRIALLVDDPAYIELLTLQDSFQYNIATRLMACIKRLANATDEKAPKMIIFALDLLQGLFLLHHPSRSIMSINSNMRTLVELLDSDNDFNIHIAVINTLVSGMVREVSAIRRFELVGGLSVICNLFKLKDTSKDVKLRILEFLFFYLIPETYQNTNITARHEPSSSKTENIQLRRTTEDKQVLLGKYLSNVDGLVHELHTSKPFGDMKHEW